MFKSLFRSMKVFSLLLLIIILSGNFVLAATNSSLLVYSGAGLRKPMDEIGESYKKEYGVQINYTYAGSAQNLSQLQMAGEGDIYVPGSQYYYEQAEKKDLTAYKKDIAYHIPVIAVPKGNPAKIKTLNDLTKSGVKVILGDERSAAIGRLSQKILAQNNLQKAVEKNIVAKAATVNELVIYINMKQADAAIIWEDNVSGVENIDVINITEDKNKIKTIPASVLSFSEKKKEAQRFVDYIASEKGKNIFKKHGFKVITSKN